MKIYSYSIRLMALWAGVWVVGFSVFGLSQFVLWVSAVATLFPLLLRVRWCYRIAAALLLLAALLVVTPLVLGRMWPHLGVRTDRTNLRAVVHSGLFEYRRIYGSFPMSLAALSSDPKVRLPSTYFIVRDNHKKCDLSQEGYLAFWLRRRREVREAQSIWDQFSSEEQFLYIQPEPETSAEAVLIVTRPGLLYGNAVNVAYVGGQIETHESGGWMRDLNVRKFLREYGTHRRDR